MPTLQVDVDVPLFYEVSGRGPAIILINGLSQTTTNWLTQSRRLAETFTVVCFDARGQGRTPLGRTPLLPDTMVSDLERLMNTLGLPRAHICGFSFGARLALAFAARCPTRVDRLILTSLGIGEDAQPRLIIRSWREVLERGGLEAMTWCALPHIFGRDFIARYERQMIQFVRATLHRNHPEGIRELLDVLTRFGDIYADAREVLAETLIILGDDDPLVGVDAVRELSAAFEACRVEVLPRSGHTVPIERPQEWRALVEDFTRR